MVGALVLHCYVCADGECPEGAGVGVVTAGGGGVPAGCGLGALGRVEEPFWVGLMQRRVSGDVVA